MNVSRKRRRCREIRKLTGISVPIPDETSSQVTDAIMEWLLLRGQANTDQQTLFDLLAGGGHQKDEPDHVSRGHEQLVPRPPPHQYRDDAQRHH